MSSLRNCRRQGQVALGGEEVLHQPVGWCEEHRASCLHQTVAHGAQCVCFPGAGQSEGQHVHPPLNEVAVGQFPQLLLQP